jgi:predicted RNase H-like HicB family nuclease
MSDFTVDLERETDGRWIGEVVELPGVLVYGTTRDEAVAKAKALAFRVLADRLEHGEDIPSDFVPLSDTTRSLAAAESLFGIIMAGLFVNAVAIRR